MVGILIACGGKMREIACAEVAWYSMLWKKRGSTIWLP